jgi:hypothetical protein
MGIIAKGVNKVVAVSKEVTWGVAPVAGSARQLRRVTANFNLKKESYESAEIRTSQQISDSRHGTKSTEGSLNGELSTGSYFDLTEAILARDFAAVSALTGMTITITASGENYVVTRAAGSFLSGGVAPGMVVQLTAGSFAVPNLNKNLLVLTSTALALTVKVLNGSAMTPEAAITAATMLVKGKVTYAPLTGHTDQSFTVEERYTDINQYERYVGNKVSNMSVKIPSNGLVTVDFSFMGKDRDRADVTPYFTSPSAQSSTGIFSGANGALILDGAVVGVITSADFAVERQTENAAVVGSNTIVDMFTGRIRANGNLSVYFIDGDVRTRFTDETEFSITFALTESNLAAANVMTFTFPRVKLNEFTKADGENGIMASGSFVALENSVTSGGAIATTIMVQDTSL